MFFNELKGTVTAILKSLKNIRPVFDRIGENFSYPWVHPVKSVQVSYDGHSLGYISVLHPQIRQNLDRKFNTVFIELNLAEVHAITQRQIKFEEPSKYPEVTLDYNFLVDKGVHFDKVSGDISGFSSNILLGSEFIDIYTGKGLPEDKKSMTFRFILGSNEKTLSSEEINEFSGGILKYMANRGYMLR